MATSRLCSVVGCDKRAIARGFCNSHHHRWMRHGDALGGATSRGEVLRFLTEVVFNYVGTDCLIWPYAKSNGYGCLKFQGRRAFAHRVACEHRNGPPPSATHDAAHSCGKGHLGCVNPRHLSWKTRRENLADMVSHGTALRGERSSFAKLCEADVRAIRSMKGEAIGAEVAQLFGTSKTNVSVIQQRKSWSWLPD